MRRRTGPNDEKKPHAARAAGRGVTRRLAIGAAIGATIGAGVLAPLRWLRPHLPMPPADGSLRFMVFGDWGTEGSPDQRRVAAAMARSARAVAPHFLISTGDNFYTRGVASTEDPHWRVSYAEVYDDPALMCPWYIAAGNHDHDGDVAAQIAYSRLDARWTMPATWYRLTRRLADASAADFFFIDTVTIAGSEIVPAGDPAQLDWLERELRDSRARWKIVVGHYPLFSGGTHGGDTFLRAMVKPLFDRYGVTAYLNGHDHDLQHVLVDGVHYLTSGAGAMARPTVPIEGSLFGAARLGFLSVNLSPDLMTLRFIDHRNRILHSARIAPWT